MRRSPRLLFALSLVLLLIGVPRSAFAQQPAPGDIVVNEILYDPPSNNDSGEYLELFNRSDQTFDLSEFQIADSRDEPVPVTAEPATLAPGEYAVLVQDGADFQSVFPDVDFIEPGSWPQLNNGGDTPALLFDGTEIDAVPYQPSWGGENVALERIDPAGPSDDASNFGNSTEPVGTPGAQNSIFDDGGDETPPALDGVTVATGRTALTAFFSEALDPASVSTGDFSLEAEAGSAPAVTGAALGDDPSQVELTLSEEITPGAYTLTVQDVSDEAGNTLGEGSAPFTVAPGAVPEPRDVVVNELWYAPANTEQEFVELFNRSGETFDLSRFALADDRRDPSDITDEPALLMPGEYVVLVRDSAAFAARFPDVDFIEVSPWPALNNGGDASVLFFGEREIDAVPYEPSFGGTDSTSLERIDPAGPSNSASNFGSSVAPAGATPGAQNSIFAPDADAPQPVFAREVPSDSARVFEVAFDEPLDPVSVMAEDFSIGSATPSSVTLLDGGLRARLAFGSDPGGTQVTVQNVADLTGNALASARVEIAFVARPGTDGVPGDLAVNEILYDPLDDDFDERPDQPEYFEIFNRTDRRRVLEGYFFTDQPDEEGEADRIDVGQPRASVPAGGFAVAYAAGGDNPIQDAFPEIDFAADSIALLPVDRSTLSLTNSGGLIELRRPDSTTIDSVFYDPDWQSQAIDDDDGRALERIDPAGPSNAAANWTSSTAESGGTPGLPNRAAPPPGGPPESGIEVTPSPFSPDGDGLDDVAFVRYSLSEAVSLVRLRIYDSYGREVFEREAELAGREGQIPWNGRTDDGDRLRIGIYVVLFEALDADGGTVDAFKEPVVLARPLN